MSETVRVGVVGLRFGEHHVRTLANHDRAVLVAVADKEASRVEAISSRYHVDGFADALEMIERADLDALSVCVSPRSREPILRAAVEKGLALFVEKPWATNGEHARRLAEICSRARAPVMTGFSFRFHAVVRKALDLVSNELGRVWLANGEYVFDWLPPAESWLWDRDNGNGFFNENSCHLIDVVCTLVGEPATVYGMGTKFVERPSEVAAAVTIRFAGGAAAALTVGGVGSSGNRDYPRLDLYTERGHLRLEGRDHTWQCLEWSARGDTSARRFDAPVEELGRTRYSDAFDHFAACVTEGRQPESSVADGVRSVLIADALTESFAKRRPVDVQTSRREAAP